MVKVYYSKYFLSQAKRLPSTRQQKLSQLLKTLSGNPFDSKLHTKHLAGRLSGLYSFRITRDWRVIFQFISQKEVQLIEVAHRKDIYR